MSYETGNEPHGTEKCGKFINNVRRYQILKRDYVPWIQVCALFGRLAGSSRCELRRSQWPRVLRSGSAAACSLRLRVLIPPWAGMSVSCQCCVLLGTDLCSGLITRPEESYWVWYVWVWSWSLDNEETWPSSGCRAMGGMFKLHIHHGC
jgi:hypothetical protein